VEEFRKSSISTRYTRAKGVSKRPMPMMIAEGFPCHLMFSPGIRWSEAGEPLAARDINELPLPFPIPRPSVIHVRPDANKISTRNIEINGRVRYNNDRQFRARPPRRTISSSHIEVRCTSSLA